MKKPLTKRLKVTIFFFGVLFGLVPLYVCNAGAFASLRGAAHAQDAPQQTVTDAQAQTISLLCSILAELIRVNQNLERLPAAPTVQ